MDGTTTIPAPLDPQAETVVGSLAGTNTTPSTLPTFSLENRVVVITGGASGLGLVMGKGVVDSGAHLAIVDINSGWYRKMLCFLVALLTALQRRWPTCRRATY